MLRHALRAGAQVGRVSVHAHGMFGGCAPYMAFEVATVGYTYALAILFSGDGPSGLYPAKHKPMFRVARLISLAPRRGNAAVAGQPRAVGRRAVLARPCGSDAGPLSAVPDAI